MQNATSISYNIDAFLTHFEVQKSPKGWSGGEWGALQIPDATLERFLINFGGLGTPHGDPKITHGH